MTEELWLTAQWVNELASSELVHARRRKLRLFACAVARQMLPRLTAPHFAKLVATSEQYADGVLTFEEMRDASQGYHAACREPQANPYSASELEATYTVECAGPYGQFEPYHAHQAERHAIRSESESHAAQSGGRIISEAEQDRFEEKQGRRWANLFREVFGNPFRPVTLDPSWLTSTVVTLAQQMYDTRDFSTMPILADALQDAGCDSDDILSHCRGPGPHVRGCWVVDLVMGKE
jgi:hypothetical protein